MKTYCKHSHECTAKIAIIFDMRIKIEKYFTKFAEF